MEAGGPHAAPAAHPGGDTYDQLDQDESDPIAGQTAVVNHFPTPVTHDDER